MTILPSESLLQLAVALFAIGAGLALLFRGESGLARIGSQSLALLGSVAALLAGLGRLASAGAGAGSELRLFVPLPIPASLVPGAGDLRLDLLAAPFLVLLGLVGTAASAYSIRSLGPGRAAGSASAFGALQNLLLASLLLLVAAADLVSFLFFLETALLLSWFLLTWNQEGDEARRTGFLACVVGQAGAACYLFSALLLAAAGGTTGFESLRARGIEGAPATLAFLGAACGTAALAGLPPFHVSLPRAHAAIPAPAGSILSAGMVVVPVYALLRVSLDILHATEPAWGALLLALGVASAVSGAVTALGESDLCRHLAASTVQHTGLLALSAGAALLLSGLGRSDLASLALLALFLGAIAHALAKSLLWLGAAAVEEETGARSLEEMGGLLRAMPVTGMAMLVGMLSLSAFPPLLGFTSAWCALQAILRGASAGGRWAGPPLVLAAALVGFSLALAAAGSVRTFGAAFLGMPRSPRVARARETGIGGWLPLVLLAGACVGLGVVSALPVALLLPAAESVAGTESPAIAVQGTSLVLRASERLGTVALGPAVLTLALALLGIGSLAIGFLRRERGERVAPTWAGGLAPGPDMQLPASAHTETLVRVFGPIAGLPRPGLVAPGAWRSWVLSLARRAPLREVAVVVARAARRMGWDGLRAQLGLLLLWVVLLLGWLLLVP